MQNEAEDEEVQFNMRMEELIIKSLIGQTKKASKNFIRHGLSAT